MSLLTEPLATPSRVRGVFRYLLRADRQRAERHLLERIISPASILDGSGRGMANNTINECLRLSLLMEENDEVAINPELPSDSRVADIGDYLLPWTITTLLLSRKNDANHNLGMAIAWYLEQDAYQAPDNRREVDQALVEQVAGDKLNITSDARYGQFEDWTTFLGFAWTHGKEKVMTPDPTRYLKGILDAIFGEVGKTLPVARVKSELAKICPVFEGGFVRDNIRSLLGAKTEEGFLSSTTTLAWFRLEEEGVVGLSKHSDADVSIFVEGQESRRISEITWLKPVGEAVQ